MITEATVTAWLDDYVKAWKTYDSQAIGRLFSADALYYYGPYGEPLRGREAIVADWLKTPDVLGTFDAHYLPIAIQGNLAVTNGRSTYFEAGGTTPAKEFDNIFALRFNDAGECAEFREWFMTRPKE